MSDQPSTSQDISNNEVRIAYDPKRDALDIFDLLISGDISDCDLSEDDDDVVNDLNNVYEGMQIKNPNRVGADEVDENDIVQDTHDNDCDDDYVEIDDVLSTLPPNYLSNIVLTPKKDIKWRHKTVTKPCDEFVGSVNEVSELLSPVGYFKKYIPDSLFKIMSEMTNIYAMQSDKTKFKPTTPEEIEILFGLHIMMGTLKFPRVRLYWDTTTKFHLFVDNMSRDRFFELRSNLHLFNNLEKPSTCNDKFFKVRPIYEALRNRCLELPTEENLCVDEAMIPFTGKFSVKQYVKGKPTPWGIKMFMLCGKSGQVYDFVIYQGSTTEVDNSVQKVYGHGASIVLKLAERIKNEKGHKLFFENFFSSYYLFQALSQKGICAAGTVRLNRFGQPPLIADRGYEERKRVIF